MKKGFTLTEVPMLKRTSGIKNEVLNSRESKTKEPLNKNKRFAAFTLTEVLITLAIISIIALVTVPNIVADYHKRVQYSAFAKMYSTLKSAMTVAIAENKTPNKWEFDSNDPSQSFKKYFYPYLKIKLICDEANLALCAPEYDIYSLQGNKLQSSADLPGNGMAVILADGSTLYIQPNGNNISNGFIFTIDTNGPSKPNTIGRDMFVFLYAFHNGKWGFVLDGYNAPENCDPSDSNSSGLGCAARLIKDGKMKY